MPKNPRQESPDATRPQDPPSAHLPQDPSAPAWKEPRSSSTAPPAPGQAHPPPGPQAPSAAPLSAPPDPHSLPWDTPPPGDGFFPPLEGEREIEHRAFLLWAMQDPTKGRSNRLTAKAVGKGISEPTIRRRRKSHRWEARVKAVGSVQAPSLALREYIHRYHHHGLQPVATVQPNMAIDGPETPLSIIRRRMATSGDPSRHDAHSASRAALEAVEVMSHQLLAPKAPSTPASRRKAAKRQRENEELEEAASNALQDLQEAQEAMDRGEDLKAPRKRRRRRAKNPKPAGAKKSGVSRVGEKVEGEGEEAPPENADEQGVSSKSPAPRDKRTDPESRQARVDQYRTLIRASIGVLGRNVHADAMLLEDWRKACEEADKAGKKRPARPRTASGVSIKDLSTLIDLDQSMSGWGEDDGKRGPQESVRVRQARANGEDVMAAIRSDHQEMAVILHALENKDLQAAAHIKAELDQSSTVGQLIEMSAG